MSTEQNVARKKGRPTKSPRGNRITVHLSLSPEAMDVLRELCDRPVEPISMAGMVDHLLIEHGKKAGSK